MLRDSRSMSLKHLLPACNCQIRSNNSDVLTRAPQTAQVAGKFKLTREAGVALQRNVPQGNQVSVCKNFGIENFKSTGRQVGISKDSKNM